MLTFPARFELAQLPTPIYPLDRLGSQLGLKTRIWIKRDDLTGCTSSGNKIRKLEFTLAEARQQGADLIITCGGVQSNHARTTAILGAQLGFRVHLLLRGEKEELNSTGNHLLDQLAGAEISCYPSSVYVPRFSQLLDDLCEYYRNKGLKPFFITTGASDATGVWGYVQACNEIRTQCDGIHSGFDHIVCAVGSGGTLAGLAAGAKIYDLGARVWGINVCDTAEYFQKKSRSDLVAWREKFHLDIDVGSIDIRVIDGYVGEGYGKADKPVYDMIKLLASREGVILDSTYTGKAFCGLINELQNGRFGDAKNILFIHTGGVFGLMADQRLSSYI